jgi:hypothetical protein
MTFTVNQVTLIVIATSLLTGAFTVILELIAVSLMGLWRDRKESKPIP